ncbi:MAG: ABC transporter substrate-binding protein, partial [Candidatus Omnitrophota bacterium]
MNTFRYKLLFIIFIFFQTFLLGNAFARENANGDTIVVAASAEPSNLIPMLASDSASHDISGLIFNGLVKYDTDLTIIGDLAENWDISDDGLVITFHLRKGVKWHDGVEFTADDVLFGFNSIIDPKVPSAYKEDYLQVEKCEVIDKYTFRAIYKKPFASALSSWGTLVVLPKHLLEGKDLTKCDFSRNPVGLGPFKFEKWISGKEIVLSRNDSYFEGRPGIAKFVSKVVPDEATSFLEFKAGNLDWMGLTPFQYARQTKPEDIKIKFNKYKYPSFSYTYFGFNLNHKWFKDKRVRQA